jgi:hypothetical protein
MNRPIVCLVLGHHVCSLPGNDLATMGVVAVGDHPQIGMERLGALIVHGIEKVDSVLVGLVRKIRIQALTDHILHFLLSHLQRGTKAGFSKSAKTTKYRVGTGCAMDFPALFSLVAALFCTQTS